MVPSVHRRHRSPRITLALATTVALATWTAPAPPAIAQDLLIVDSTVEAMAPGVVAVLPFYLLDSSGTPLGLDAGPSSTIQGLALTLEVTPAAAVDTMTVIPAGILASVPPLFETQIVDGNRISWIATFDEGTDPIPLTLDAAFPGDLIGELQITLGMIDQIVSVAFVDPTALGNQPGSSPVTTQRHGGPDLGTIKGLILPTSLLFADGFESGSTSAW